MPALLRPVGFHPREISAIINQEVIDQHAEEAAFLWMQRDHATTAPQYALKDLARLDERVEAHVDGLRVAADAGWATALTQMEQGRGEVFAASVLAFESGDPARTTTVLETVCSAAPLAGSLISALGWMEQGLAVRRCRELVTSQQPEICRAGIGGMAVHRIDPGSILGAAIAHQNTRLAARALKAAAELGRRDLLPEVAARISDSDDDCRFWAAWSAVRLGDRHPDAMAGLRSVAEGVGPLAVTALDMALRAMRTEDGREWQQHLAGQTSTSRLAVIAIGTIGDAAAVPELIAAMENPKLARAAGAAFSMITGADLGYEHLDGDGLQGDDEDDALGVDAGFPWPAPAAVTKWWVRRAAGYVPGVRYLRGQPMTDESLREVLVAGRQNQRAAAALELALRHSSEILFETRERAQRQKEKVRPWSS
jgi:uncharacterized protein (TIGR02270 family)